MAQDIEFGVTHVGLDELIRDIMAAGDVPDEVQKNMVRAKAKIVEEAEVYTAGTMLVILQGRRGPEREGQKAGNAKKRGAGGHCV